MELGPGGAAPASRSAPATWALRGGTLLPSPGASPIEAGVVLVREGRIAAIGPDTPVPPGVPVLDAAGSTVVAGFWNCHVHFTEERWRGIRRQSEGTLEAGLAEMLTRWGFTRVVDTGSDPRITLPLRQRIESGGLRGPRIRTATTGIYPPHGLPYYLRGAIPWWARWYIPQPATPRGARRAVRRAIGWGADLVKLFTGSYVERGRVRPMPGAVARAAVEAAHAAGRPVFSHPSDLAGTEVALESGVDVLAHPPDSADGVEEPLLRELVRRKMAMIPTLKMFANTVTSSPEYLEPIYEVVRRFRELGGELLFGTDVGYLRDYSTEAEFEALGRCGLTAEDVLRALTTAPARRLGSQRETGTLEPGQPADLVLLEGDPTRDLRSFARVRATFRDGRPLWGSGP